MSKFHYDKKIISVGEIEDKVVNVVNTSELLVVLIWLDSSESTQIVDVTTFVGFVNINVAFTVNTVELKKK